MRLFRNDYSELCHENIIKALNNVKCEQNDCYGLDKYSISASEKIKNIFDCKDAEVHFLCGGTQTNMTFISYLLRDYEAVLACESGHINVHETGSVEGSGHKVFVCKGKDGKLSRDDIVTSIKYNCNEHMVKIKMVYISNSTETGTIYSLEELKSLYDECKKNDLYLFIDGARLGVALTSKYNDVRCEDISKYCDAFYIGGTKNGLMIGEALVIVNKELHGFFRYQMKNKGAMLAKGYLLGIQFDEIFKDDLYFKLARTSNEIASLLKDELLKLGLSVSDSPTNQIFLKCNKELGNKIIEAFGCELWSGENDTIEIRFVTSFNSKKEDVEELIKYIKNLDSLGVKIE